MDRYSAWSENDMDALTTGLRVVPRREFFTNDRDDESRLPKLSKEELAAMPCLDEADLAALNYENECRKRYLPDGVGQRIERNVARCAAAITAAKMGKVKALRGMED